MDTNWPYGDPSWFTHDRFGLFIHWGLYSLGARHEWLMNLEKIPPETYEARYFPRFNPKRYDPAEWARLAKRAGMRYAVLTTKHHDGFCLWDSQLTDYTAAKGPSGRDLVREYVEAFRAEGLKVGFYHSLLDWHHPDFPVDGLHPLRDDEERRVEKRDIAKYREYLHGQVLELLTNYGRIDYMWFDFSYPWGDWEWSKGKGPDDWGSADLEKLVLSLQPEIIMNDRLGLGHGVKTPEQHTPEAGLENIWESCQTITHSWGYYRGQPGSTGSTSAVWVDYEPAFRAVDTLVRTLVDCVSKGGNLLLNVGPNGAGEFDKGSVTNLEGLAEWMRLHSEAIYGCGASAFEAPRNGRYTQNGNRLFLHMFTWDAHVVLPGLAGKVEYVQLLADASEVRFADAADAHGMAPKGGADSVTLTLPPNPVHPVVPVVELILKD